MKLPNTTLKDEELLPIGTEVAFNHRAGVARFKTKANPVKGEEKKQGWVITDGVNGNELIQMTENPFDLDKFSCWDNRIKYAFFDWPQAKMDARSKYNKTVLVWPVNGRGYVIGKVRKSVGASTRSHYSSGGYYSESEFEPGYHSSDMYVDLYVIKTSYNGTDYILCPIWAVTVANNF
jgi:hypothetical protein